MMMMMMMMMMMIDDDDDDHIGIVFDPYLSWNKHVKYMSTNVFKRIGVIRRVEYRLPSNTIKINLFAKAFVFPHFDCCSRVV